MEKIKTIVEYQKLAERTCVDLGSDDKNANHMWLGIITEAGEILDVLKKNLAYKKEVDLVNLGEEFADTMWYVANSANFIGGAFGEIEEGTEEYSLTQSIREYYKEYVNVPIKTMEEKIEFTILFYRDFITHFNSLNLLQLYITVRFIVDYWGFDFYQILTNNIEKLKVRYPEKFTEESALNRDLDAERKTLEQ